MNIAIAMTQFVMLALAAMASRILVNSGSVAVDGGGLSGRIAWHIADYGVWLLVIPVLWLFFSGWCQKRGEKMAQVAQAIGAGIAFAVLAGIVLILAF